MGVFVVVGNFDVVDKNQDVGYKLLVSDDGDEEIYHEVENYDFDVEIKADKMEERMFE